MRSMMYLIKFGGSVITEKSNRNAVFKKSVMDKLAKSLASAGKEYIIVHGAGSFGHVLAKEHNLNNGFQSDKQRIGFSMTQTKVQQLNTFVLQSLQKQGLPTVSIPPHATISLNNHVENEFKKEIYNKYLSKGFIPVTYGDVVLDKKLGFSICSGDLLIESLSESFKPEKVIFVMDEDGLYKENPKMNSNAAFIDHIYSEELKSLNTKLDDHADVTGGMQGKIKTILQITNNNIDVLLLNGNKPDRLYDAIVGNETKYTLIQR